MAFKDELLALTQDSEPMKLRLLVGPSWSTNLIFFNNHAYHGIPCSPRVVKLDLRYNDNKRAGHKEEYTRIAPVVLEGRCTHHTNFVGLLCRNKANDYAPVLRTRKPDESAFRDAHTLA
ncbi:hypothetical protein EVAR_42442_1 [Eumeta japonica]|uniref:Uncharacterized protein n=1 Tax=Eumeta variegata TaxID=151549 RepID=A0A4C1XX09_EUMVA|nr:hypothetical protein EVAR_42442_1 [Eumeta japonica]